MKKFFISTVLILTAISFSGCDNIAGNLFSSSEGIMKKQSITDSDEQVVDGEQVITDSDQNVVETDQDETNSEQIVNETDGTVTDTEQPVTEIVFPVEITDYEFYGLFSKTLNNALSKISLMQNSGMDKLGEETQYGDVSGTVHYNAKFNFWKMKATVVITFDDYCDTIFEDQRIMVLNDSITTLANSSGNGELFGTIYITGFYSGYVDHQLEILSQEKNGGNYIVYQEGAEDETLVPWDYILE